MACQQKTPAFQIRRDLRTLVNDLSNRLWPNELESPPEQHNVGSP